MGWGGVGGAMVGWGVWFFVLKGEDEAGLDGGQMVTWGVYMKSGVYRRGIFKSNWVRWDVMVLLCALDRVSCG